MGKTFVVSDESLNSYGFRVITAGIDFSDFLNNPIMLYNHARAWEGKENEVLPIGRWENVRVEGDKLLADAVFDEEDAFALKISKKVEKGILNMCSAGLSAIEESEAVEHLLPGQRRATLTKSKLKEISIADIGSNSHAVALYDVDGKLIKLTAGGENCPIGLINNKNENNMKLVALKLGLPENATEVQIAEAITQLMDKVSKNTELTEKIVALETAQLSAQKSAIVALVAQGVTDKKFTADKQEHFIALGEKIGIDFLRETISLMSAVVKPNDLVGRGTSSNETGDKKFSSLSDKEVLELRTNDKAKYSELYKKEFGFAPKFENDKE